VLSFRSRNIIGLFKLNCSGRAGFNARRLLPFVKTAQAKIAFDKTLPVWVLRNDAEGACHDARVTADAEIAVQYYRIVVGRSCKRSCRTNRNTGSIFTVATMNGYELTAGPFENYPRYGHLLFVYRLHNRLAFRMLNGAGYFARTTGKTS
jgi:hypothetical protein